MTSTIVTTLTPVASALAPTDANPEALAKKKTKQNAARKRRKQRQRAAKLREAKEKAASSNSVGSDDKNTNNENVPENILSQPKSSSGEGGLLKDKKRKNKQRKPNNSQPKQHATESNDIPVVSPAYSADSSESNTQEKKKRKKKRSRKKKANTNVDTNKVENFINQPKAVSKPYAKTENELNTIKDIPPVVTPSEENPSAVEDAMLSLLSNDFEKDGKKEGDEVKFVDFDNSESDVLRAIIKSKPSSSVQVGTPDKVSECMTSILSIDKQVLPVQRSMESLRDNVAYENIKNAVVEVPVKDVIDGTTEDQVVSIRGTVDSKDVDVTSQMPAKIDISPQMTCSRNAFVPLDDDRISSAEAMDKGQDECGCAIS